MSYELNDNENLNFIECVQMLNVLIKNGVLHEDPSKKDNIFIYHAKNEQLGYQKEGWYLVPTADIASELRYDEEGQRYLRNILKEKSIPLVFEGERIPSSFILDQDEIFEEIGSL